MFRTSLYVVALMFLICLAPAAIAGTSGQPVTSKPVLLAFSLPSPSPVANWTFSGCWSPGLGRPCVDVYRDANGDPWICKACGTTGNPSPGKCRRTSQAELDAGRWCS